MNVTTHTDARRTQARPCRSLLGNECWTIKLYTVATGPGAVLRPLGYVLVVFKVYNLK